MKTEYLLTEAQKAELADIDRQIEMLCRRRADIYMRSNVRYVTETREGFEAVENYRKFMTYGMPVIRNEGIVKMIFEEDDGDA